MIDDLLQSHLGKMEEQQPSAERERKTLWFNKLRLMARAWKGRKQSIQKPARLAVIDRDTADFYLNLQTADIHYSPVVATDAFYRAAEIRDQLHFDRQLHKMPALASRLVRDLSRSAVQRAEHGLLISDITDAASLVEKAEQLSEDFVTEQPPTGNVYTLIGKCLLDRARTTADRAVILHDINDALTYVEAAKRFGEERRLPLPLNSEGYGPIVSKLLSIAQERAHRAVITHEVMEQLPYVDSAKTLIDDHKLKINITRDGYRPLAQRLQYFAIRDAARIVIPEQADDALEYARESRQLDQQFNTGLNGAKEAFEAITMRLVDRAQTTAARAVIPSQLEESIKFANKADQINTQYKLGVDVTALGYKPVVDKLCDLALNSAKRGMRHTIDEAHATLREADALNVRYGCGVDILAVERHVRSYEPRERASR